MCFLKRKRWKKRTDSARKERRDEGSAGRHRQYARTGQKKRKDIEDAETTHMSPDVHPPLRLSTCCSCFHLVSSSAPISTTCVGVSLHNSLWLCLWRWCWLWLAAAPHTAPRLHIYQLVISWPFARFACLNERFCSFLSIYCVHHAAHYDMMGYHLLTYCSINSLKLLIYNWDSGNCELWLLI